MMMIIFYSLMFYQKGMPFPTKHFFTHFRRRFTRITAVSAPPLRCTNQIAWDYKIFVFQESQKALTEYLHATQGLPFFFADQIARNSLFSLSNLLRNVPFSAPDFPTTVRKYLRYQALNEFEFFFESIGIDHQDIPRYLPRGRFFLASDGMEVFEASMALFRFGFPWNTLGRLYAKEVSIFRRSGRELTARLGRVRDYCRLHNLQLVGVFLAFPELLTGEGELGSDSKALFEDVKMVFKEFENGGATEHDVDAWYGVCCKIRLLYKLDCERGTVGEFMRRGNHFLLECPRQVLEDKLEYFCKFGVGKDKVGPLLLQNPEWWGLDLQAVVISVSGLLQHFGLDNKELRSLTMKYPHVFGRNKMSNLLGITRALDLHEWFCDRIKSLGSQTLVTYAIDHSDEQVDKKFQEAVKKIESTRCHTHTVTQLNFLMGLGFGDNAWTLNVLRCLLAAHNGLQERFEHLLSLGIKHSNLCLMMKTAPRILRLTPELVDQKIGYLCEEMESSVKYLDCFPRFLVHDLDNRIKPRHRFFVWLRQNGLDTKNYSIKTMIDTSEKRFIARILSIHRAAPKLYLECYIS